MIRADQIYLPMTMIHEFGHTAGLDDLYKYQIESPTPTPVYPGYLMDNDWPRYPDYLMTISSGTPRPVIPQKDIEYLEQVYRNEHGSEPH